MDASQTQVAIAPETVQGTIATSPAFLILRDQTTEGGLQNPFGESPERRADRRLAQTFKQPSTLDQVITLPLAYDAALDLLLASAMNGAWATNVLKDGGVIQPFTLEKRHEGGATDPYFWSAGMMVDSLDMSLSWGNPGSLRFSAMGLKETTGTAAKTGATYGAASQNEPITPIDIVVNSFFDLDPPPRAMQMTLNLTNNARRKYAWGSKDAYAVGLGRFRVGIDFSFYFEDLDQYTALVDGALGVLDFTMGVTTTKKYQFVVNNAKVTKPAISDGGNDNDEMVSCHIDALFDSGSSSAMVITRAVA